MSQPATTPIAGPNQLAYHLIDLGVGRDGGKWALRELEDISERLGHRVSDSQWREAVILLPVGKRRNAFKAETLEAMTATLRHLRANTNIWLMTQYSCADSGIVPRGALKASDDPTDLVRHVLEEGDLSATEQARFVGELIAPWDSATRREHVISQLDRLEPADLRAVANHLMGKLIG